MIAAALGYGSAIRVCVTHRADEIDVSSCE